MDLGEDPDYFSASASRIRGSRDVNDSVDARKRPKLTHTKSDTNVHRRNPFRDDSPPLPLAPDGKPLTPLSPTLRSPSIRSRESSCGETNGAQKRHISFNTFVEQCIAIENPETPGDGDFVEEDEDDFDIPEEMDEYRDYEEESDNEEYGSEDDVLEMRPGPHMRTYNRRTPLVSGMPGSNGFDSNSGLDKEHVTIAPIAPTMLKTSASPSPVGAFYHGGYGSVWEDEEEEDQEALFTSKRSHAVTPHIDRTETVTLVYVPPQGSVYAERMPGNGRTTGVKSSRKPFGSPPPANAQLRPALSDEDDVELITSGQQREDGQLDVALESGFDLCAARSDMGGVVEECLYRSVVTPRSGRSPAQARSMNVSSDLASRVAADAVPAQVEDSCCGDSKGSSSSVSEDGTVMPPSVALPSSSSPRTAALRAQRDLVSPVPVASSPASSPDTSPAPSASIPIPNHGHVHQVPMIVHQVPNHGHVNQVPNHGHVHQVPSPAPSSTSTGTSSTNSGGSVGSYGSPFLEPPSRGRSSSPNTSPTASGDSVRGRSSGRGSSISLSDVDREPQRGRSRSRSIGTVDGSVSPRSGSHNRLSRRASIDCGGIGLGGLGVAYGLSVSPTSRGQSLSPEGEDGTGKGGKVKLRVRRSEKEGSSSSLSPPSKERGEKIVVVIDDSPMTVPRSISDCSEASEGDTVRHIIVEDADAPIVTSSPSSLSTSSVVDSNGTAIIPPGGRSTTTTSTTTTTTCGLSPSPISIHISSSVDESATLVSRAVSSAKGYLGTLWGAQGNTDASNTSGCTDR